jgi:hypothetical protein
MKISHYSKALRTLFQACNLLDAVGMLSLYTAAKVIAEEMERAMESLPSNERHIKHDYIMEKLSMFIEYFGNAAMPVSETHKTPSEWLEAAGHNLFKVEIDTAD